MDKGAGTLVKRGARGKTSRTKKTDSSLWVHLKKDSIITCPKCNESFLIEETYVHLKSLATELWDLKCECGGYLSEKELIEAGGTILPGKEIRF